MAAFGAALAANLIHNDFGLDLAIAPAVLFGGLYLWRPGRVLLWVTAFVIAFPAFSFLQWDALAAPSNVRFFLNHIALLLAGALAVTAVLRSVLPAQRSHDS